MAEYMDRLNTALKEAMKSKDKQRRDAIRLLTSAIKQVQIDERKDLSTDEEQNVLIKEAKKRRESIEELESAGRDASEKQYELDVITGFLPEQMSRDEIEAAAKAAIAETGAETVKDMGKVMGKLSMQVKGRADGKLVSTIVRELLG